ncbi:MAG: sugar phosphate isomerase/epimerase [Oscillospiraceae bacterium]|nr:sugar phosphate isomerase/epimerase [Oscillospiraceae bacterium]
MKKSINAWSIDSKTNFDDMFSQIKKAGFDGIELNVDAKGNSAHSLTLETTDKELADILALSKKYNLLVVSISTSLWWSVNMGSANKENRENSRKLLEKQLICAKTLGASGILTVPGGISEDTSIAEAYKNSFDTLESCKDIIEEYKLKVGLENVWNTFFVSPFDMANFIDSLKCKYISAYYDVGNGVAFSWSEYWIEILGNRISHIHIKDFKRNSGINSGGTWPDLLKGDVNFRKIIPALKKAGWDGYLTAEIGKTDADQSFEDFYKETVELESKIIAGDF